MGAKIPDYKTNDVSSMIGGAGNPAATSPNQSILNAVTNGVGTGAPPSPNWGSDINQSMIADPNKQYQPIAVGTGTSGVNPNTDINAGVPISNTPSINQQNSPGFGFNSNYGSFTNPSQPVQPKFTPPQPNIINSLMGGGAGG